MSSAAAPHNHASGRLFRSFLNLEPSETDYASARFALLPIPYDGTVSYRGGTRLGPQAIVAASEHLETFDEELRFEPCDAGIAIVPGVEPDVDGPGAMHEAIYRAARPIVDEGKFLVGLGGEHSVTSGLVRAVAEKHAGLSILQIDAHLDLRDTYQGSPHSHACVMRRCLDYVDRLVPVGIRNVCVEEDTFLRERGIAPFMADTCVASADWIPRAVAGLGDDVYVTIDIDGFDPAYAPGTGTPVPGGIDWYRAIQLLRAVAATRKIVALDVVEVAPIAGQTVTEFLAARLIYKTMAYTLAAERGDLS